MLRILNLFIFIIIGNLAFTQSFSEDFDLPFIIEGKTLRNPLMGGFNAPQFSNVDLNNDGYIDIIIFDRSGNVFIPLLNDGTDDPKGYDYAPEFIDNFPKLINWVLLRDYDLDGVEDIFSYSTVPGIPGIEVHKGSYLNDEIIFEKITFNDYEHDLLSFPGNNGLAVNLYVSNIDYPAIDDVDCDGDLDVVTFNSGGGYVEFFKNLSQERNYANDSLIFVLSNTCYGGIYESGLNEEIALPCNPGECGNCFTDDQGISRHPGSSLLTLDKDNDGDKELLLGDISFKNITMLNNNGDCDESYLSEQIVFFPEIKPVEIPFFPTSFYLDVDKDGIKDFIAAPNNAQNSLDTGNVWFYKNHGANLLLDLEFKTNELFCDEMLDLGSGSRPTFVDVNADGLQDLVVGTLTRFDPEGEKDARLYYFENTGTRNEPMFELIDDNFLNFQQYNSDAYTFTPTFGDLDSDGDVDILVGEQNGTLFYGENLAGPNMPLDIPFIFPEFMGIDVRQVSTPLIYDLDNDGLNDLIVGERNGNVNFFKNVGSLNEPMFGSDQTVLPNTNFMGQMDTRQPGFVTGYSCPVIIENETEKFILTGSQLGRIFKYENISDPYGKFEESSDNLDGLFYGDFSKLTFADIDNDGELEMIGGNSRGGLNAFNTNIKAFPVSTSSPPSVKKLSLYPQPANDFLKIDFIGEIFKYQIYDSLGKLVISDSNRTINTSSFSPGLYVINVKTSEGVLTKKFILY